MHQAEVYNAKILTQHGIDVPANTNRRVIDQCVHIVAVKHTNHSYKIKLATIIWQNPAVWVCVNENLPLSLGAAERWQCSLRRCTASVMWIVWSTMTLEDSDIINVAAGWKLELAYLANRPMPKLF